MCVCQSCPTLWTGPMDCRLPNSSVHGIFQTRVSSHSLLHGIFLTQELNLGIPHCREIFYHLSHQGSSSRPLCSFIFLYNINHWSGITLYIHLFPVLPPLWRIKLCFVQLYAPLQIWKSASYSMLCYAKSLQSCPTLCHPIDGSPPGFPVPGILARTLEWVSYSIEPL